MNMKRSLRLSLLAVIAFLALSKSAFSFEETPTIFKAAELDEATLQSLIGAEFSYSGHYVFRNPSDTRRVRGSGLIIATKFWPNGGSNPTFTILMRKKNGQPFRVQTFQADHTFKLAVKSRSSVAEEFFARVVNQDLKLWRSDTVDAGLGLKNRLENSTVPFQVLVFDEIKKDLAVVDIIEVSIPDEKALVMNMIDGKPLIFSMKTVAGEPRKIKSNNILAISYR